MNSSSSKSLACPLDSTVAVFFDVAKAFDRQTDISHLGMSALTRQDLFIRAEVPQGSTFSPLLYSAYTNDIPRPSSSGVQLALFADDSALFYGSRNRSTRFTLLPLQRAIDELGQWFRKWRIEVNPNKSAAIQFKMVMTYASPVFAHAAPKALHRLQVIQNKFCRAATDAHWEEREPTRDGFLRHSMPRRLPPGVVHRACHATSALACAVWPHSLKLSKSSDLSSDSSRPTK
ncbi:Probable RNA-directed DNA polymerase from transposon X-element [Eumeta japonica]|uniref:Probable RNA-directed DNA polymerase from transposon X-element n=1 Tax=Eumeta variegata TaxID=151549 RepID=A0A4C2A0C0_EUMVA|nr:Probable RNA-directed DNA polymerase from transposon X-element [Eumeta japonica]